ncbi:MAG: hypothetical protein RR204_06265, partial [Raoultibacter sp.]
GFRSRTGSTLTSSSSVFHDYLLRQDVPVVSIIDSTWHTTDRLSFSLLMQAAAARDRRFARARRWVVDSTCGDA